MKIKSSWGLGGVLLVLAAAYIGAEFLIGSAVKAGVNRFAPSITHTDVRLEEASISPLTGGGSLTGLFVGNPKGWSGDKAFFLGRIHVRVSPASIFSDCIVINDISIDSPEFVYQTRFVSSNIGDLLKNIEGTSNNQPQGSQPSTKDGKPLRFIVKHFSLTNGHVTLGVGPTALTLPMPTITLDDVGTREGGITSSQLALALVRSMTGGVISATTEAAGKIGSTLGAAAGNSAKSAGQALKDLFHKN